MRVAKPGTGRDAHLPVEIPSRSATSTKQKRHQSENQEDEK